MKTTRRIIFLLAVSLVLFGGVFENFDQIILPSVGISAINENIFNISPKLIENFSSVVLGTMNENNLKNCTEKSCKPRLISITKNTATVPKIKPVRKK